MSVFKPALLCLIGLAALALVALLFFDPPTTSPQGQLIPFLGHFHPVVLHLPIGFLILLICLELLAWRKSIRPALAEISAFVATLTILATLAAVGTGWLLAYSDGASEPLLQSHMRNGILLALSTLGLGVFLLLGARWAYRLTLGLAGVLLFLASHQGGSITHGSGYLTKHTPNPLRPLFGLEVEEPVYVASRQDLVVFEHVIQPIVEQNCQSCHNPNKLKGELDLTSYAGFLKGGDLGPSIELGNPEDSELYFRLTLPRSDEEAMPPEEKPPLAEAEVETIRWWIAQGASPDQTVGQASMLPPSVDIYITDVFNNMISPEERERRKLARQQLYADLSQLKETTGLHIRPMAPQSEEFALESYAIRDQLDDETLKKLIPFSRHFVEIDLSGSSITDTALPTLARFENLNTLNLSRTALTGKGLGQLSALSKLKSLNLYGTTLQPQHLDEFTKLNQLRDLFLFQTPLEKEPYIQQLEQTLPGINFGIQAVALEDLPPSPSQDEQPKTY